MRLRDILIAILIATQIHAASLLFRRHAHLPRPPGPGRLTGKIKTIRMSTGEVCPMLIDGKLMSQSHHNKD